jgi:hypothetical protein
MGYERRVEWSDSRAERWVGEHRPELIDLTSLLQHLIELEPEEAPSLERWRIALPEHATLVRLLGARTAHIRIKGGAVLDVVVKLMLPHVRGAFRKLAEQVRHSRAQRAYLWAHRLRALGIETPRPLGFVERAERPALEKSFVVTEYVFAPSLIEFRDQKLLERRGREALLEKRALIQRVAELVRELHRRGLSHAELGADHLLVPTEGPILLVDLDRVEELGTSARSPLAHITRLCRDFKRGSGLTRTDRMRFLATYLRHAADPTARRRQLFLELGMPSQLEGSTP